MKGCMLFFVVIAAHKPAKSFGFSGTFEKGPVFPVPALGAKALIFYVVHCVDGDLCTFKHKTAVDHAAVAGGLASAGADGFQFLNGVSQFQQAGGAGKTPHHKICAQPVADDRDAQVYRYKEQLFRLLRSEKLTLITQHTGQGTVDFPVMGDQLQNVHFFGDQGVHLAADTETGDQHITAFGIDGRLQNQNPHAAFGVIEGNLQKSGGFAAVHGTISEIELCH